MGAKEGPRNERELSCFLFFLLIISLIERQLGVVVKDITFPWFFLHDTLPHRPVLSNRSILNFIKAVRNAEYTGFSFMPEAFPPLAFSL